MTLRRPNLLPRVRRRVVVGPRLTLFEFALSESRYRATRLAHRRAIVDALDGWIPCRIVGERESPRGAYMVLTIAMSRPIAVDAARAFARELPGFVDKSFRALDATECRSFASSRPTARKADTA